MSGQRARGIARGRAPASAHSAGFTLVEVMVAMFFLSLIVLSLAGATDYANRVVTRSRTELAAQEFLERETERLRLVDYAALASGTRAEGRGIAKWQVVDSTTFRQVLLETRFGSPATGLVVDTVVLFRRR